MKDKSMQMPEKFVMSVYRLIVMLEKYDLQPEEKQLCKEIETLINEKIERMNKRELYTKYKTGATEQEREQARKKYLDEVGMHEDWRY